MDVSRKISRLYGSLESMEAALGGGGGFEGFYGSVTANGVSRVYASMSENCGFDRDSFLVDIGGGVGRPLVHALVQPGLKSAVGLELDEIKCLKSESVIREAFGVAKELAEEDGCVEPRVLHRDIEKVNTTGTLDPATHAYAFWEGIPTKARVAFGELFKKSSTLRSVAIVQRAIRRQAPEVLMAGYNFGSLQLMDTLKGIHMSGSNRSFTAYVFKRLDPPGHEFKGPAGAMLSALLTAPRLLQASLPRLLRQRKPNPAFSPPSPMPYRTKAKPAPTSRVRVALQDTMPQLRTTGGDAAEQEAAQAAVGPASSHDLSRQSSAGAAAPVPWDSPAPATAGCAPRTAATVATKKAPRGTRVRRARQAEAAAARSRPESKLAQSIPAGSAPLTRTRSGATSTSVPGFTQPAAGLVSTALTGHTSPQSHLQATPEESEEQRAPVGQPLHIAEKLKSQLPGEENEAPAVSPAQATTVAHVGRGGKGQDVQLEMAVRTNGRTTRGGRLSPVKRTTESQPLPASPTKRSCGQ